MNRRKLLASTLSLVTLALLAGCGGTPGGGASKPQSTGEAASPAAGPATITFLHWRTEDKPAFEDIIAKFEQQHKDIKVKMEIVPPENYAQTVKTRAISGDGIADVIYMNPGDLFLTIAKSNGLVDLSNEPYVAGYLQNNIEAGNYKGKQLGLPYTVNYVGVIYNKNIFKKLNLPFPQTWQQFMDASESLKKAGYIPLMNGGADAYPVRHAMYPMLSQLAKQSSFGSVQGYADAMMEGKIRVDDPVIKGVARMFQEFAQKGYYPKENMSTKYDQASALFAQEKAAMVMTGSWAISNLKQQNKDLQLGLAAIPLMDGPSKGSGMVGAIIGVGAKSKHQTEAKKFLAFLSTPEIGKLFQDKSGQIVLLKNLASDNEDIKLIREMMKDTVPTISDFSTKQAYMDALGDLMSRVLLGQPLDQSIAEVQKKFDSIAKN